MTSCWTIANPLALLRWLLNAARGRTDKQVVWTDETLRRMAGRLGNGETTDKQKPKLAAYR